ncbi:hypothetical protein CI102_13777 [Trichoderma harzianum]|nr:hypothetical protein CI102_13777 [Trichoderma harzianum]
MLTTKLHHLGWLQKSVRTNSETWQCKLVANICASFLLQNEPFGLEDSSTTSIHNDEPSGKTSIETTDGFPHSEEGCLGTAALNQKSHYNGGINAKTTALHFHLKMPAYLRDSCVALSINEGFWALRTQKLDQLTTIWKLELLQTSASTLYAPPNQPDRNRKRRDNLAAQDEVIMESQTRITSNTASLQSPLPPGKRQLLAAGLRRASPLANRISADRTLLWDARDYSVNS